MLRFLTLVVLSCFTFVNANAFNGLFKPGERKHIHITGSSTVYPFTSVIAESFKINTEFKAPVIESTGTGGGFKLFCAGIGRNYPDFSNASRRIKKSEVKKCMKNGIKDAVEIKIGYDGIVLANSNSGPKYKLTKKHIFLALAAKVPSKGGSKLIDNPYKKWSEIDKSLPSINIAVYGPPTTSGTRDAFVELVMEKACASISEFSKVFPNSKIRKKHCKILRSDGVFIEAGENDNLIVQKLRNDHDALGIFGFSFLEENRNLIQPVVIDNIVPSFDSIISGSYPVSRPLFIYFKKEHLNLVPGVKDFIQEIVSEDTIGSDGYLLQKGLIPLTDLELKKVRSEVENNLN